MPRNAPRGQSSRRLRLEPLEERALLTLLGNTLFPADNPWNQRIDNAPVAANSSTLVASIGAGARVHPDFGTIYEGAYIGIPFNVVTAAQTPIEVVIDAWPDESDLEDVPIPEGAVIEGDPLPPAQNDGDRHLIVYDRDANVAYELYNTRRPSETADGKWHADAEAVWNFNENDFRTPGDTSADAAGLPILPGLVRPDEVLDQGVIDHALRFTVPRSRNQYVFPASHQAGQNNASYPRMGERFRLKQDFDISGFSATNQVILRALKEYGMIVADNGSAWYLSGEPSERWDDDDLHELSDILGSNFEAVDLRPIVVGLGQSSGPTAGGTTVTIVGQNFSGNAGQLEVFFGATAAESVSYLSDTQIVATSPAHASGTVHVTVETPYGTSATSSADEFTFTASSSAAIAGRHVFYNQSAFDGNSPALGVADDGAIATDKTAYLPGSGVATFAGVTSYSHGINGIIVDIAGAGSHAAITTADFVFKVGNNNSPAAWSAAPAPTSILVRTAAGTSGSDRVEIAWAAGAIRNQWLEVQVLANVRTGLASPDVHFWGNRVGDSGTSTPANVFQTTSADASQVFGNLGGAPIDNLRDYNRSGSVTSADAGQAFANLGTLQRINIGAGGPFAPEANAMGSVVAAALSMSNPTNHDDQPPPRSDVWERPTSDFVRRNMPAGDAAHALLLEPKWQEPAVESRLDEADSLDGTLLGSPRAYGTLP